MDLLKKKAVQMVLVALLTFLGGLASKGILSQQGKTYVYRGVTFTVPQGVVEMGTNQVAIYVAKLRQKIDEM